MKLDINKLHRKGGLKEGAVTEIGQGGSLGPVRPGQKDRVLVAGLGSLSWREQTIEFEWLPIITRNRPPSWGSRSYARPRFICPADCGRTCYHLHQMRNGLFACRICSLAKPPCRDDPLLNRLEKLRAKVGMTGKEALADPPPPPPKSGPRARWLRNRRIMALRLAELEALGGSALEEFFALRR